MKKAIKYRISKSYGKVCDREDESSEWWHIGFAQAVIWRILQVSGALLYQGYVDWSAMCVENEGYPERGGASSPFSISV